MSGSGQPGGSSYTRPSCPPPVPTQPLAPGEDRNSPTGAAGLGGTPHCCLSFPLLPSLLCTCHPPWCAQAAPTLHHGPTPRPHTTAPHHGPRQPLHNERRGAVTHAASAGPRAQHHARSGWLPVVGAGGFATSCSRGLKVQVPSGAARGPSSCTAGVLQQWGWEEG